MNTRDDRTIRQRQLNRTTEHIRHEAAALTPTDAHVPVLAKALDRHDFGAAAAHARTFLSAMPGWRAEESAFNALLTVREMADSPLDDLERTLSALPDEKRRDAALDAFERRDWAGVEQALDLDARRRTQVYCERLLELLSASSGDRP